MFTDTGGFRYHCFNCGYIAGWEPTSMFGRKVRDLLHWMNVDDKTISELSFKAAQTVELDKPIILKPTKTEYKKHDLPEGSKPISKWIDEGCQDEHLAKVIAYVDSRGFELDDYEWHWTPETEQRLNEKLIIPCKWHHEDIGYISRSIKPNSKIRYLNHFDSDYVFNTDAVKWEHKYLLVVEGVLDAVAVNGVALLSNQLTEEKVNIINRMGKQVILVPDRDESGMKLAHEALERGWNISWPAWEDDVKDSGDALQRYGRLYTLMSIIEGIEENNIKSELRLKDYK